MKKIYSLLSLCLLLSTHTATAQKEERNKQSSYEHALQLIESDNYTFRVKQITTSILRGRPRFDFYDNTLSIINGNAKAILPHVARSHVHRGGAFSRSAIQFDNSANKYKSTIDQKKKQIVIEFEAEGEDGTYACKMTVLSSDRVSLSIYSKLRPVASYTGFIEAYSPPVGS